MNYKQYNEELIEDNYKLREENIHLSMLNYDLEMYLKEHKQKIDKAIEYIKEHNVIATNKEYIPKEYEYCCSYELLSILGDKE